MARRSRVLFLCTGNLCRSPTAAGFLARRLRQDAIEQVDVRSAGTLQVEGRPPVELLEACKAYRLEMEDHRPHRIELEDVKSSDLVLAMAREHLRAAVLLDREALSRTFTLREFVRRAEDTGPRHGGQPLGTWLKRVNGERRPLDLVGESTEDDVVDPIGGPLEGYRDMLEDLDDLCNRVYELTWGAERTA